jgi:hypothetical protein
MALPPQVPATRRCYSAFAFWFETGPSIFPSATCPPTPHSPLTLQCGDPKTGTDTCIDPDTYYCLDGTATKWRGGGNHPLNSDELCFWRNFPHGSSEWHQFCAKGTD